jgi:hypothetical protein
MKRILIITTNLIFLFSILLNIQSCSLVEENPGGFTMETMSSTVEGYQTLINQCYFAMQRYFYGAENWMMLTEAETDLWTYIQNKPTSWTQWFWFFAGAAPNTTYTNNWWNGTYDGIGSCNTAIYYANNAPFKTEEERNAKIAEARFLRAVYYFNAVEQFGGITMIIEPAKFIDYHPERTDPLQIYEEIIIPDLKYAFEWLSVGTDATTTIPTKKSALGFLAKACLQTIEYDPSKKYAPDALNYAKMLIDDAEAGGANYNAYMYPSYSEVFKEKNNWSNKEALWKHRWYAGPDGHGSSNGNYKLNRNNEYFSCDVYKFGAFLETEEYLLTYEGNPAGKFMPTQHLLSLYVQDDGSLDPRFRASFTTEWKANVNYTWDETTVHKYDRETEVIGKQINAGDLGLKFIMPQDENYPAEAANKLKQNYLVVDYKDVYNDINKNIYMTYSYKNPSGNYTSDGTSENLFSYFYPSLNKHNSSNFYVADANKKRNGNLNATFIMRMAEIYLIAAEADLYVNGGANTLKYLNKVRSRAGARPLTGPVTLSTILDERGRELCGEYCRFYDLKRTGKFKDNNYLQNTHPDLAVYFKPEYALRPIPTSFLQTLEGGGSYYQNPGY